MDDDAENGVLLQSDVVKVIHRASELDYMIIQKSIELLSKLTDLELKINESADLDEETKKKLREILLKVKESILRDIMSENIHV